MKSLTCVDRQFWKEFLNLYKQCPALWDIRSGQYKNKERKEECYNVLVNKLKAIDPHADHSTVRRKINILRTNFLRELNRVTSNNVKPSLWYFEDMMFTLCNDEVKLDRAVSTTTSGIEMESKHDVETSNDFENHSEHTENTDSNSEESKEKNYESIIKEKDLERHIKNDEKFTNVQKREYWKNFIKLYKSFPALWKTNSVEYKDRKLKEDCYEVLIQKLRMIEPDADRAAVRKKINTLRCNFRREQNRFRRTQRSSKLWYYNDMMFINDQGYPPNERDESLSDSAECLDIKPDVENSSYQEETTCPEVPQSFVECKSEVDSDSEHSVATNVNRLQCSRAMFNKVTERSEDEIDLQGKIWAAEFRKLSPEQQLFAKKAIDDILFERRRLEIIRK